ncbi:caspase family protein [Streptomyces sp. UH6]|uniref:HD domain-containing protein n=1 Tax=Streptomyces sp. UH6 TaxID=2748379 RepID=UPI0015D4C165|nr:caspase family protein [Streptomyces sp. UH6]NYV73340.1 caspase family protein [Streptomyces sp. UH6]
MGRFRALLIPVTGHVPVAAEDAKEIKEALLGSGWQESCVEVLGEATRTAIYEAFHRLFTDLGDDDFALVYYSGHGVRIDGADYLVPADATEGAGPEGLIELNPDTLLARLATDATVLLCVDACRDDIPDGQIPKLWTKIVRPRSTVSLLYACPPGDIAEASLEEGSFMGRALAEALSPESRPATLGEVIAHVKDRTQDIARQHGSSAKVIQQPLAETFSPSSERLEICTAGPGYEEWSRELHKSRLWDRTALGEEQIAALKTSLGKLVTKVLAILKDANRAHKAGPDPWDDLGFVVRVLHQLETLVPPSSVVRLSPLEVVTLLATPFVREAAVACGRRILSELYPRRGPGEDFVSVTGREVWDQVHEDMADVRKAYAQIEERRLQRVGNGPVDDPAAVALEHWLRHRLLAGWDQLWDPLQEPAPPDGYPLGLQSLADAVDFLITTAAHAVSGPRPEPSTVERLRPALLQVVTQMRSRPVLTAPDGKEWNDTLSKQLGRRLSVQWRPKELAGLLHMAELLAIDPRAVDGIVVDHLAAAHLGVTAEQVVTQIRQSVFKPVPAQEMGLDAAYQDDSDDWTLHATCAHAALHVALERQAAAVATAAEELGNLPSDQFLLSRLPRHVNTDALISDGSPHYNASPPRFQLAEDGVKPLIMGTQLYGDHMLALRELYQNALDACRRRRARQEYAYVSGQSVGAHQVKDLAEYTITLTMGRDDRSGRLYLRCSDNGIGMTEEEIRELFARAGKRYEQSPTRIREMRRWRRKGIKPELNSRFGIGVFSYFMLAEEIQVITRPASETGLSAESAAHQVHVVSDSGLMHITRAERTEPGTDIVLHLRREFCDTPPSPIRFFRENVWHSPVRIQVEEEIDGVPERDTWPAGELRAPVELAAPQSGSGNVWWVRGEGARLVDGILVRNAKRPHGYVINLHRRHAPVLSASRNDLQKFDTEETLRDLLANVGLLTDAESMPLTWLWALAREDARLALEVVTCLMNSDAQVSVTKWHGYEPSRTLGRDGPRLPLKGVGCLPGDAEHSLQIAQTFERHFFTWWRSRLVNPASVRGSWNLRSEFEFPQQFPEPIPLDAAVFRRPTEMVLSSWAALAQVVQASLETGCSLREALRAMRRYAVAGVPVQAFEDLRILDREIGDPKVAAALLDSYAQVVRQHADSDTRLRPPVHAAVLLTAGRLQRTVAEVVASVHRLRAVVTDVPEPPDAGALGPRIPDQRDVNVLEKMPRALTPASVAHLSETSNVDPSTILEIARRYAAFGYQVDPYIPDSSAIADDLRTLGLTGSDASPRRLLSKGLTLIDLVNLAAGQPGRTIADVTETLRGPAARLGLDMPDPGALGACRAPSWWECLFDATGELAAPLSTATVLRCIDRTAEPGSPEEVVGGLRALAEAGVVEEGAHRAAEAWLTTVEERRQRLPSDEATDPFYNLIPLTRHQVKAFHLMQWATGMELDLGEAYDAFQKEAAPYGIDVQPVPAGLRNLRPNYLLVDTLCTGTENLQWREKVDPHSVAAYAEQRRIDLKQGIDELRAYESLGGPRIPYAGIEEHAAAPSASASAARALLRFSPLEQGTLTPLTLTVSAVRLGHGLRTSHRLLARYADIGLTLSCPEPPDDDHEPDWRDVLILTRYLNGSEPALRGDVPEDHLRLAAEETDLTVAQVRERLAYYAPLFGFRLPGPTGEEPPC